MMQIWIWKGPNYVLPDARNHIRILNRKYFATENTSLKKERSQIDPKAVPGAT